MAKKKNIVKNARSNMNLVLILIVAAGWGMAVLTLIASGDAEREQAALIAQAQIFLEDKLYVRAVGRYQTALSDYQTAANPTYEEELLAIYKEAGMMNEYYAMIDERIAAGAAGSEEYLERAREYISRGSISNAMEVLKQGIKLWNDETMITLYESVCYEYSSVATVFSELRMPSSDWLVPAFDGEHWGYIGASGRTALGFNYEDATPFSGSYAVVKLNGVFTLIDKSGYWNAVDKNDLDQVTALGGSYLVGVKDGQYGLYSRTFQRVGEEGYDNILLDDGGMIAVQKDGVWSILNSGLEPVSDDVFLDVAVNGRNQFFGKGYAVVADEGGYYLIDQTGNACFENRFSEAKGMEEGLFAVKDASGKWGFANEKGELVVECRYEDARSFSNKLAAVQFGGKWGYINRYNTWILEPQFAEALPFREGKALVADEQGFYHILTLKYYDQF